MAGYNIGPKIGIDGEKEFRDQIKSINTAYKTMEAELKAVSAAYDANGDEAGKLTATVKVLEKQIDEQRKKLPLLEDAIAKASKKYGENSTEVTRLQGVMYDTQATISGLERKLRDAESGLTETEEAVEDLSDEMDDAGDAAIDFGSILKGNLAADLISDALDAALDFVKDFAAGSIEAAADVKAANAQFEQTFKGMEKQASNSLNAVAKKTGVAATRMQNSYTALYAFSKNVGADSADALDISSRAMVAAADNAAYYDKSIEEATETLQSFLKGNYENDAALGIAATETTRNAKANERYAKSFDKLSESQKVDVLLSMVEAGNAASGALGNAAREADEWTNVTGEATEALHQLQAAAGEPFLELLTPAIKRLTETINALLETTAAENLTKNMEEFKTSIENAAKNFDAAKSEAEGAAYAAEYYAGRLADLEKAGLNNSQAQLEYKMIVEELNGLLPDLNLVIDDQTGLINKNIDAILGEVAAWKQNAVAKALQQKFTAELEAQGKASADLYEAKAELIRLEGEEIRLTTQLTTASEKLRDAQDALAAEHEMLSNGIKRDPAILMDLEHQVYSLTGEYGSLLAAVKDNQAEQEALTESIGDAEKIVAEYEDTISLADEALQLYTEESEKAANAQDDLATDVEALANQIAELEKAYDDAKVAARESIDQQIGLFEELSSKSDYSAKKIIENWRAQREAFAQYESNLKKAVDLDLDETLVKQLSDGSYESMLILDALVNDTTISVGQINSEFANMSESRDSVSEVLGDIEADFSESMANLVSQAKKGGWNTMDGLIGAIGSKIKDLKSKMVEAANAAMGGYNYTMDINSPSRVMTTSGEDTMDGAIIGVDNRIAAFRAKMAEAATAGSDAFLQSRLEEVENYPTYGAGAVVNQTTSSTVRHEYGGVAIQIYPQAHQSANDIADAVLDRLNRLVVVEGGSLGG